MSTVEKEVSEELCTGCGGCENICPVDAITMTENSEGFIMPSVDSGKCVSCQKCLSICPALNEKYKNNPVPEIFAVKASDKIRSQSSSGGVFTLLAEKVITEGGVVYGAAFDENMQLRHISAESLDELAPLRGSKYLQSNTGKIYREIKKKLSLNRKVLFVGTPCQAAALRGYLGQDYENLFIVDLVCHGVPSQAVFDRYLKENFPDKKAKEILFRNKSHGWSCAYIDISFEDGSVYNGSLKEDDAYEILFQRSLGLRKSCADCKFCDFPRVGDISIGDFWGIDKINRALWDTKGISMVLVNNEHGRNLFDSDCGGAEITKINCNPTAINNRLKAKSAAHAGRDYFFKLLEEKSVYRAVRNADKNKHDIGLVGIYTVENFGGALTYYALYKTLCDLNYNVLMIERPLNSDHKPAPLSKIYNESPYPEYDIARLYFNKAAMTELNNMCDTFIVGSDQLFNDFLYNQFGQWCTLDWVNDNKKKIAYAASFGHDHIWSPEDERAEMSYFMRKFDDFSVREESGVKICADEFGLSAEKVLDPIFLCDPSYYTELAERSEKQLPDRYISAYILDPDEDKAKIIKSVSERFSTETDIYTEMNYTEDDLNGFDCPINFGGKIEDRLASIINSDMVIADSFHGICMAIIMKKNFIAISNAKRGNERFFSVLKLVGLENRLIDNSEQLNKRSALWSDINYNSVYEHLNIERERSLKWLKDAVFSPMKKSLSTYDILIKQINNLSVRLTAVTEENAKLRRAVQRLSDFEGFDLYRINSFVPYFKALRENSDKYVIAIAVKDTPGMSFTDSLYKAMVMTGTKVNLVDKHWHGYAALIDGGKLIDEKCRNNAAVAINAAIDEISFYILSKPLKAGNMAVIKINGNDYSVNSRGINIVVYDKERRCVCDSVCFDTHVDTIDCHR